MALSEASSQGSSTSGGIAASLTQLAEGLGKLIAQHLRLAKIELTEEAKTLGPLVARMIGLVPLVIVGHGFVMAALVVALTRWLPLGAALAAVGALNLVVGTWGLTAAAHRLKTRFVNQTSHS